MTISSPQLEDLVAAYLAGEVVAIPEELQPEFQQALAGHAALEGMFVETVTMAASQEERQPPQLSADYEIERELGRGGMGVVYLVRQKSLERAVALKVLRPGERTYGPLVRRFLEEARHLARLRHPHIVSIHEIGDAAGEPYFTMDYVAGESLAARLKQGALSPTQAVAIFKQIAAAVQHAHQQGIIHRDLKPSNVLLDAQGQVFVTDFGLARDLTQASELTLSGELLGTPQYMAPEQARGEATLIGEPTDIHALGMILYEMLTGKPPYGASSAAEVLVRLMHSEPVAIRQLDRRIPRDLETIVLKMLRKTPAERYANVTALLEDLRRYEAGEPLLARRPSLIRRAIRWSGRHWRSSALVFGTAVVVAALSIFLFDKTHSQLIQWGDEELAMGEPDAAAQVYWRAWQKGDDAQRYELIPRLTRACREMEDSRRAVQYALEIIARAPETSFGHYDYLVAQALQERIRSRDVNRQLNLLSTTPNPELKVLKTRLELALNGPLTPGQIKDATHTLEQVNLALSADKSWARVTGTELALLPVGTVEELRAKAEDQSQPHWNRAKAWFVLAGQLEKSDPAGSEAAYRAAYTIFQQVFPFVSGIKLGSGTNGQGTELPDVAECQLVEKTLSALQRLAPQDFPAVLGGIEFGVTGEQLPPQMMVSLQLEVLNPEVAQPDQGLPHMLPRSVPLPRTGTAQVRMLPGAYRLKPVGHSSSYSGDAKEFAQLLQVELNEWPVEITITKAMQTLPPVNLRLLQKIVLREPADNATIELDRTRFHWQPVEQATKYQVQFFSEQQSGTGTTRSYFGFLTTTEPELTWSKLSEQELKQFRTELPTGKTGGWKVSALGKDGRQLAATVREFHFLVGRGLD